MEDPPVDTLDRLALYAPPAASFSSLPYELVSLIASYLDPSPSPSSHEAPSITRLRREAGRSLALVSRNAREVGTELVWRRVVVGFHRNPDLLHRVSEEQWMAAYVKQLHVVCSPKTTAAAQEMDPAEVLPLFTALDELSLAATPPVLEHFLSPLSTSPNLVANLTRLVLISSFGSSPTFSSFLLHHLPLFTSLSSLTLDIRLPVDTELDLSPSLSANRPRPPLSRLHNLSLTIEDAPPSTYPIISTFLSSLSSLISFQTLRTFALYSPYTDDFLLSSSLSQSSRSLTSLTLSLSIGPLIARLPSLLDLLPTLSRLRNLKVLVQPPLDAPLIFPPSHALRPLLFSSLSALEELESVELDFDSMDSSPVREGSDTASFLASRLHGGAGGEGGGGGRSKLRVWQTVEWEEALRLRRVVIAVRRKKEEGGEEWEVVQENLEDDG